MFLLMKVCLNLRMHGVRVADRLADPQGQQGLVAGVGQGVYGFREHAGRPSVHPCQELEEEVQPIAVDKRQEVLKV